jgi:hypothetical protein
VRHDIQDAYDAHSRNRVPSGQRWHPLLAAVEAEPGHWFMVTPDGKRYGIIRMLEIGGERGYRAVTWAERSADRQLIGYYRTLKRAAEATHRRYLDGHGRMGFAPNPWSR